MRRGRNASLWVIPPPIATPRSVITARRLVTRCRRVVRLILGGLAGLLSAALVVGCSAGNGEGSVGRSARRPPATMVAEGQTVEVARLTDAVAGLCQAHRQSLGITTNTC